MSRRQMAVAHSYFPHSPGGLQFCGQGHLGLGNAAIFKQSRHFERPVALPLRDIGHFELKDIVVGADPVQANAQGVTPTRLKADGGMVRAFPSILCFAQRPNTFFTIKPGFRTRQAIIFQEPIHRQNRARKAPGSSHNIPLKPGSKSQGRTYPSCDATGSGLGQGPPFSRRCLGQ
jgi:hypothetical protein